jgi:hypothetical protein
MKPLRALIAVIFGAIWALFLLDPSSGAAASGPELELGPAELQLAAGEQAEVLVIVRNSGNDAVAVDSFVVSGLPGITATPPDVKTMRSVAAGSAVSGSMTVVAGDGFDGGKISVQARGRTASSALYVASATLTLSTLETGSDLTVALLGVPDSLADGQAVHVVVRITNPTWISWSNVRLQARGSDNLCWLENDAAPCRGGASPPLTMELADLPSGGSFDEVVVLRAEDRVRAGTQAVSVVVTAYRVNRPSVRSLATAQANVKLSVFGVDVLSPFGLANLFLIPGAVAVLTFQLVRRLLQGPAAGIGDADLKDPGVLLSVVPVGVLVYLSALFLLHWNIREKAGTTDAVLLFVAGGAIGAITAMAWWLRWWWVVGRKRFSTKDSTEKVLKRIHRRRAALVQPTVTVGAKTLQLLAEGDGRTTACPRIDYEFCKKLDERARGAFVAAVDNRDLKQALDWVKRKKVHLSWHDGQGVVEMTSADATPTGNTRTLLGEKAWTERDGRP